MTWLNTEFAKNCHTLSTLLWTLEYLINEHVRLFFFSKNSGLCFNTVHLFIFEDSVAHTYREQSNFQKSPFELFSEYSK